MPAKTFDLSTKVLYSRQKSMIDFQVRPDAILTPLLWAYNSNLNQQVQVCIGDLPNLARLERVANSMQVTQLQQVFAEAIEEWGDNGNFGYNPQLKYKEHFLDQRVAYMAEVI